MTAHTSSVSVIEALQHKIKDDEALAATLTASLAAANETAKTSLAPNLYQALEWPTTVDTYISYLETFSRWAPQQSGKEVWLSTNPAHPTEHQEVYDRLCHFYFLVDQPAVDGTIVENDPWFSRWLVDYANLWGSFLNTTESFNDEILQSFISDSPQYRVQDSMIDGRPNSPSGWLTFNQFFARELNPGLRPITEPLLNTTVTAPADCTYKETYSIGANSDITEITVKQTHRFGNVADLLVGSPHADAFVNGTFVHYFLGPNSYHRFHTPVAGKLLECRPVTGDVYLDVNVREGQFDAPDSATDGYEFTQARGIVVIDTSGSPYGDIGIVGVVPIGMCQVSSVNMTATVGSELLKGDEFGYFLFGGSDIIVLFQEGAQPMVDTDANDYRLYGTTIATCSSSS